MVESLLAIIGSNAIVAAAIGSVAWLGSRCYQWPSLWHAVWVLAIVKLFLPPIWSIATGISSNPVPVVAQRVVSSGAEPVRSSTVAEVVSGAVKTEPLVSEVAVTEMGSSVSRGNVEWGLVALSLWCTGSLIALTVSSYRIARFHALVRRGRAADEATTALAQSLHASLRSSRSPRVRIVDDVVPPLLWPLGATPTIVLPQSWWLATTEPERRAVLMHELVHARRGDAWVRLLQWLASVVFWWHPLVWIARRELHVLEEQCCDAEVLDRLPGVGRAYATALISASEWLDRATETALSRLSPSPLAIPMSDSSQFESFHRRIQMLPTLKYRPWTAKSFIVLLLATAVPLATGLNAGGQPPAAPEQATTADKAQVATVSGLVTDIEGKPLADAQVRLVIPAADLRQLEMTSEYREVWGTTDASGKYTIEIPGVEEEITATIDVLHRGHRRVPGALMGGDGDESDVTLTPGGQAKFDAKLPERAYFAGRVVDEAGEPIEGVHVFGRLSANNGGYSVEWTWTNADGEFALYCYDESWLKDSAKWKNPTAAIDFQNDDYVYNSVEKLEAIAPTSRDQIKVVLQKGFSIAGRVLNADKSPASGVAISMLQRPYQRKGVVTDADGKFRFDGVASGSTQWRIVDITGNSKWIQTTDVNESNLEMTVMLEKFESPLTSTYQVLGMTMADVTDAMKEAYDDRSEGAIVTDPGKRSEGFEIGDLRAGDVFWMVGMEGVDNLRAMVSQLIQEAKSPTTPPGPGVNPSAFPGENGDMRVRVVYSYHDDRGNGTNTQYMKLTPADVSELEQVLKTLP